MHLGERRKILNYATIPNSFVLYLEILAIQHLFFFTLEYYHLLYQECRENFTTS